MEERIPQITIFFPRFDLNLMIHRISFHPENYRVPLSLVKIFPVLKSLFNYLSINFF